MKDNWQSTIRSLFSMPRRRAEMIASPYRNRQALAATRRQLTALPDASVSGNKQPCWRVREEVGQIVARGFAGSFNENGDWQFKLSSGLRTYEMTKVMKSLSMANRFYRNFDVLDHGITGLPFVSGSHWELNHKGDWYHFIFLHGTLSDLQLTEFHYEKFRPTSYAHLRDVLKTWGKTDGEIECAQ
jgi:hypothetical protein